MDGGTLVHSSVLYVVPQISNVSGIGRSIFQSILAQIYLKKKCNKLTGRDKPYRSHSISREQTDLASHLYLNPQIKLDQVLIILMIILMIISERMIFIQPSVNYRLWEPFRGLIFLKSKVLEKKAYTIRIDVNI